MKCRKHSISVGCSEEALEKWRYKDPGQTAFSFLTALSRVSVRIRFVLLGLGLPSGVIAMLVAESGVLGN